MSLATQGQMLLQTLELVASLIISNLMASAMPEKPRSLSQAYMHFQSSELNHRNSVHRFFISPCYHAAEIIRLFQWYNPIPKNNQSLSLQDHQWNSDRSHACRYTPFTLSQTYHEGDCYSAVLDCSWLHMAVAWSLAHRHHLVGSLYFVVRLWNHARLHN